MKIRATRWAIRMIVMATALATVTSPSDAAEPMGTSFIYQGQLKQDGVPVTGSADFEFHLWDAESGGAQLATVTPFGVALTNGLFTVDVDFGPAVFDGSPRWLEIQVAYPSGGALTPLTGRQPITPAPYALALPGLWSQQNDTSPNLIGGYRGNTVTADVAGATIGGGGSDGLTNSVTDEGGTIGGGRNNQAGDNAGTTIDAPDATVAGGHSNTASGLRSTVSGGRSNTASAQYSTVGGGYLNRALESSSVVSGGSKSSASGNHAAVGGGYKSVGSGDFSAIGGGQSNTANGEKATIPGGSNNTALGDYSFAAGQRAQANHGGAFVWSDSTTETPDYFASTDKNQFLIKAAGGVGINTNSPGAALHIGGTGGVDGLMFPDGTLQTTAVVGGSGDSLWSESSGDIFYTAGKVGVGTSSPGYRLHVVDTLSTAVRGEAGSSGGYAGHFVHTGAAGTALYAESAGLGRDYATLQVHNTRVSSGMAAYMTSVGSWATMHVENDGTGEVLWLARDNSDSEFIVANNEETGGRVFSVDHDGLTKVTDLEITGETGVDGLRFPDGTLQTTAAGGGGGDSPWSEAAGGIYYNSGNVSIGHPSPPTGMRLLVRGDEPVGIKSETSADTGWAMWGVATHNSSDTIGVYGNAVGSASGVGVYGSGGSTGLKGEAPSSSGVTYGVWGNSNSPSGTGVYGKHYATTGTGFGVYGITRSEDDWSAGVQGYASSTAISSLIDKTIGVSGFSQGGDGIGVFGQAMHSTTNHATYGGYFESVSNFGTGVYGEATHTSGINYGVRGVSPSPNGFGGYFKNTSSDGTALYAESAGAGSSDATLRVNNTQTNAGMAASFTSVGSYATVAANNDGTGEVLWLSRDNTDGEFIVAYNEDTGGRVFSVDQDGWTKVSVLEITGGADLSEQFDVASDGAEVEPGLVVAIDPENPGKLVVANKPYDYTVAGVVSGAGGVKPGMLMGQKGSMADGKHPIALTGRVWTWCNASNGAIKPGDLLTTSNMPGHAMKVTDRTRAQGAMIGKAMTSLSEGKGLVLVLVSLQ